MTGAASQRQGGDFPDDFRGDFPGGDTIRLAGLRVRGRHGVYDFERAQGQDFVVDVVLHLDLVPAAASDDVSATVHYGELADTLAGIIAGEPVNLIETLAARLADACLADPRVDAATVTVHKPGAPVAHTFTDISVTIHRSRRAGAERVARGDGER